MYTHMSSDTGKASLCFISIFPVEISWTVMTVMNKSEPDASMVCPCWPQVTHRARNMEAVQCKEQDSTCLQLVWDATTVDIHHDNKMPNSVVGCWEYTAMRPHVVQTHHAANLSFESETCTRPQTLARLHYASFQSFQLKSVEQSWQSWTSRNLMLPWFALVGHKWPTGLGIWKQCNARSRTRLACSWFGTPPLWIYTMTTRCPTVWWAAENTQPCVHMSCKPIMLLAMQTLQEANQSFKRKNAHVLRHWQGFIMLHFNLSSWNQLNSHDSHEQVGTWCFHGLPLLATSDPQG